MAIVTNAFSTYGAIGNREDLTDAIYNISPTDTPFMSMAGRTKAEAVTHEWQTDSLAAAASNAQLEGDTTSRAASTPTTRLSNLCQISSKNATVTGTQQVVKKAGRTDELAYLMAKRSKELKRDMETILVGSQARVAGDATTARQMASLENWLQTNDSRGPSGVQGNGGTTAVTDGTQRDLTETLLKSVLKMTYNSGGNPTTIMVGPSNKQVISGFTGRTNARNVVDQNNVILGAASIYMSDFGDLKVVPNRFQRDRTCLVLDPEYWAVAYLRSFERFDLAKVGDAETKVILSEYTLEARNEAASGVVADLNTP